MDDKREIVRSFIPRAVLKPMTREALEAVPSNLENNGFVGVLSFPFKIGRDSRVQKIKGGVLRVERLKVGGREPTNDLYLLDRGRKLNISREHLTIDKKDGQYLLIDRGSVCGTKIDGENVGGARSRGEAILKDGDQIVIGSKMTPYVYKFIVLENIQMGS